MLQITKISEDDMFFIFMDELKPWANQEVRSHGATAMTIADTLEDTHPRDVAESPTSKTKRMSIPMPIVGEMWRIAQGRMDATSLQMRRGVRLVRKEA